MRCWRYDSMSGVERAVRARSYHSSAAAMRPDFSSSRAATNSTRGRNPSISPRFRTAARTRAVVRPSRRAQGLSPHARPRASGTAATKKKPSRRNSWGSAVSALSSAPNVKTRRAWTVPETRISMRSSTQTKDRIARPMSRGERRCPRRSAKRTNAPPLGIPHRMPQAIASNEDCGSARAGSKRTRKRPTVPALTRWVKSTT